MNYSKLHYGTIHDRWTTTHGVQNC